MAAEQPVSRPSCDHHAQISADKFECRHHDSGYGDRYPFGMGQKHHTPVEQREPDDVNEKIGDREHPDDRIPEYHTAQEGRMIGLVRFPDRLLPFARNLHLLKFGQPYRRRFVAQRQVQSARSQKRERRRNEKAKPPCAVVEMVYQHGAHHEDQPGPDRMRHVPDRHFAGQFVGRHPVSHERRHGWDSHALKITVQQQDRPHDDRQRCNVLLPAGRARDKHRHFITESESDIDQCTERKSQRHDLPGAYTVGDESVDKAGQTVNNTVQGQKQPQLSLGYSECDLDARHGGIEILADKIIKRITDHRHNDCAGLPVLEFLRLFGSHYILN